MYYGPVLTNMANTLMDMFRTRGPNSKLVKSANYSLKTQTQTDRLVLTTMYFPAGISRTSIQRVIQVSFLDPKLYTFCYGLLPPTKPGAQEAISEATATDLLKLDLKRQRRSIGPLKTPSAVDEAEKEDREKDKEEVDEATTTESIAETGETTDISEEEEKRIQGPAGQFRINKHL